MKHKHRLANKNMLKTKQLFGETYLKPGHIQNQTLPCKAAGQSKAQKGIAFEKSL